MIRAECYAIEAMVTCITVLRLRLRLRSGLDKRNHENPDLTRTQLESAGRA